MFVLRFVSVATVLLLPLAQPANAQKPVNWWELFSPEEQKTIFAEYERHLYSEPVPRVKTVAQLTMVPLSVSYRKALNMFRVLPGGEDKLIKAYAIYSEKWDAEKEEFSIAKLHYSNMQHELFEVLHQRVGINLDQCDGKLVAKLPDRMIDDCIRWLATRLGSNPGQDAGRKYIVMIGHFGPRAEKAHGAVRQWGVRFNATVAKQVLDKIQKK